VSYMPNNRNDSGGLNFSRRARRSCRQGQSFATPASRATNIPNEINEE